MVNDKEQVNELLGFARSRPKTKTITVKRKPPQEPSLRDKVLAKRKEYAQKRMSEEMRDEKIKRKAEYVKIRRESTEPNEREYDYEGEMAKVQLRGMIRNATELMNMLDDNTNMAEWVQNKITKAADYIDTARDYMMNDVQEAIMTGTVNSKPLSKTNYTQTKVRGSRTKNVNPINYKAASPDRNDVLRQKASGGRHRQYKAITSTQSSKQQAANKERSQKGQLRNYGKGKLTLNKVL